MTLRPALLACAIALLSSPLGAAEQPKTEPPKYKSAQEIIDASPADAWRALDPANTLYLELETGRVIIIRANAEVVRVYLGDDGG